MAGLQFEWDEAKNQANQRKHGVSFEEAQTVFFDEHAVQFSDDDVLGEDRFLMLGRSSKFRVLMVVHCFRDEESVIRIISARKPTKKERAEYPEVS